MQTELYKVTGMTCGDCTSNVTHALKAITGSIPMNRKEVINKKNNFLNGAVFAMAAAAGPSLAAPGMVYVADEGSDTVSVLDAESFKKVATIAVGREPHNVQLSPDGKLAWVTTTGERRKAGPQKM